MTLATISKDVLETDQDTFEEEGGLYPYDPTKADIDIREAPQTVFELVIRKFDKQKVILNPDFQRGFVWKRHQMSSFIESIILNFPLPPLYINQDINGRYIVVDGVQRITTLRKFLKNEFSLKGLQALPQLNGKKFDNLKGSLQSKIEDTKLNIYLIKPSVPLKVVYDIFYRINTGGSQLQRQEIRNCIYAGKATELLKELAGQDYFKQAIGHGISDKRMKDQEAVLRYLAFKIFDYKTDYKGDLSAFLENAMKKINTQLSEKAIENLKTDFKKVMTTTYDFFGNTNFRFPTLQTRGRINIAMLESIAYFFSIHTNDFLNCNKRTIIANFKTLLADETYVDAVRVSTGDKKKVINRFNQVQKILGKDLIL